jgi:ankyrin repeat protein
LGALKTWLRRLTRHRIFDAIERGDDALVLKLAQKKRTLRTKDEWGRFPLPASILRKRSHLACQLIEIGAHQTGDNSVIHASMCNDLLVVNKLIEAGATLDELDAEHHGWSALMWATNRHHFEIMKALLSAGANIDSIGSDGSTAIMCTRAGRENDLVALEVLCAYQPKLTVKDCRGRTIIDEARDRERFSGKPAMKEILIKHYPEIFS